MHLLSNERPLFARGCRGLSPHLIKPARSQSKESLERSLEDLELMNEDDHSFYDVSSRDGKATVPIFGTRTPDELRALAPCAILSSFVVLTSRQRCLPSAIQDALNSSLPSPGKVEPMKEANPERKARVTSQPRKQNRSQFSTGTTQDIIAERRRSMSWSLVDEPLPEIEEDPVDLGAEIDDENNFTLDSMQLTDSDRDNISLDKIQFRPMLQP